MKPMNPYPTPSNDNIDWINGLRPELLRYCRSLSGSKGFDPEDLVQETLVRVLNRQREEPGIHINRSYVFRTARNLWIDHCRRLQKQQWVPYEDSMRELPAVLEEPDTFLITRELLEQMMYRLLPKPFVVVLLCDVFQLTAREAGHSIRMSEGAVQVTLSRARKRLRKLAAREEDMVGSPAPRRATAKNHSNSKELLAAVMEAFRQHDPQLIYAAYIQLFENGSQLTAISSRGGRLYFTFRDPEGNVLLVSQ